MAIVDGVWYSDAAMELMSRLAAKARAGLDGQIVDQEALNEMRVIEAFYDEFPGLTMTDREET